MEKLILFLFPLLFWGASCSFKNPEDSKNLKSQSNMQDSDGDYQTDLEEKQSGSNPFLADIPTFEGEFFEEMKVTTHFHNPKTNKNDSVTFQVRKNQTSENGTPFEERDFLTKGSQFLIEQNELLAKRSNYKASYQVGEYNGNDIGYYAPPRMNDLKIFPFSERISDLSQTHEFEEIEFFISNRMNYGFKGAKTYTDLVFDLYWYNNLTHEFMLIGTDFLSGIYQFNSDSSVPLSFRTTDKELTRMISISGGRFLYLKLRDFKIIETNKFYKQILSSVKEKSIPVLFFDGDNEVIRFVGTNGKTSDLSQILKKALSDEVQIYNSKIVRIGQKSEKEELARDPFGESSINHFRFQLLTNEIANSPFTYSFGPGDILGISYVTSSDPYALVPSYYGARISSEETRDIKTIKIMTSSFKDLRLNLRPGSVKYTRTDPSHLIPCPYTSAQGLCWSYKSEEILLKGVQALAVAGILTIKINDKEFRLDDLLASKDALFRQKNGEVIEIKFKDSLLNKIPESNGLTISFSASPSLHLNCDGVKICESNNNSCEKFLNNPPSCEAKGEFESYSIIDKTKKFSTPLVGNAFFSIEYI